MLLEKSVRISVNAEALWHFLNYTQATNKPIERKKRRKEGRKEGKSQEKKSLVQTVKLLEVELAQWFGSIGFTTIKHFSVCAK